MAKVEKMLLLTEALKLVHADMSQIFLPTLESINGVELALVTMKPYFLLNLSSSFQQTLVLKM